MLDKFAWQNKLRRLGQTFERFKQCMQWASEGKTFIYYHPDFVAIDMKSWEAIDKKLHPPKRIITYYDEYDDITPEKEVELRKWLKLPQPNNKKDTKNAPQHNNPTKE